MDERHVSTSPKQRITVRHVGSHSPLLRHDEPIHTCHVCSTSCATNGNGHVAAHSPTSQLTPTCFPATWDRTYLSTATLHDSTNAVWPPTLSVNPRAPRGTHSLTASTPRHRVPPRQPPPPTRSIKARHVARTKKSANRTLTRGIAYFYKLGVIRDRKGKENHSKFGHTGGHPGLSPPFLGRVFLPLPRLIFYILFVFFFYYYGRLKSPT
ncbi:hypothetical protein Syun_023777 [Stephania yunnanensis]|uniref:Uncharacterized protein n=1 Tax=Stephania yunnanensis TaxID=152371 RepID=A0AAP0F9M4_9MAGN